MATKRIKLVESFQCDESPSSMDLYDICEQCGISFENLLTKICNILISARKSGMSKEFIKRQIQMHIESLDTTMSFTLFENILEYCNDLIVKLPKNATDKDSISEYFNNYIEKTKNSKGNTPKLKFPRLINNEYVGAPSANDTKDLFIACVKYLAYNQFELEYKSHNQWASMLLRRNYSSADAESKMSKIKLEYDIYFLTEGLKYIFDVNKIVDHFPYLFQSDENSLSPVQKMFKEIQQALTNEFTESKLTRNRQIYKLVNVEKIKAKQLIYECDVITKDEEIPHFREGLSFSVRVNNKSITCEVVDYELDKEHLYFTSPNELPAWGDKYAVIDLSFIIDSLKKRIAILIQNGIQDNLPIYKFLVGETQSVSPISHTPLPEHIYANLDNAQLKAFSAAIDNDITFVWGPPGTGKSFTLAAIIRALYEFKDERTIVCCVSNVAVDALTKKVIDIIDEEKLIVEPGNFYRAGHSTDERIITTDYLFPKDEETMQIRKEIQKKHEKLEFLSLIQTSSHKEEIIEIKAEIKNLRIRLKNHTEYLVGKSRVVYSTIANFILNEQINKSNFDNLIVDEASMLALPQLLALAKNIAKRIILVGDFQQLSPISLVPNNHLRDNVFKIAGIDINHTSHKALHLLMNQRRSHKKIVNIINMPFYGGKLHATIIEPEDKIVNIGPFAGRIISTKVIADCAYRFTKGNTRQNKKSAEYIMKLVRDYYYEEYSDFSIGIITPYKGQASLLKALLMEENYEQEFLDRIKIGTVHTFQGSECDIIIYDIVDCGRCENNKAVNTGKIYGGEEGEQLLNVALSRARHKLIVVGDAAYFDSARGNQLSAKTLSIFRKLSNYNV